MRDLIIVGLAIAVGLVVAHFWDDRAGATFAIWTNLQNLKEVLLP
jgi:hypothetical protein